jgi:hypothetical protein
MKDRNQMKCDAAGFARLRDFLGCRLSGILAVRSIADNGREAFGRERLNVFRLDLSGDGAAITESVYGH